MELDLRLHSSICHFLPLKSLRNPRLFPGVSGVCLSLGSTASTKLEHVPVKDVVVGETLTMEQVSEQLAKVTGKFYRLVSGRLNDKGVGIIREIVQVKITE